MRVFIWKRIHKGKILLPYYIHCIIPGAVRGSLWNFVSTRPWPFRKLSSQMASKWHFEEDSVWSKWTKFKLIPTVVVENSPRSPKIPTGPFFIDAFCLIWNYHVLTLKIHKRGRDFCDTFETLKNTAGSLSESVARDFVPSSRATHIVEAQKEFLFYHALKESTKNPCGPMHLIFDFAEN